MNRALRVEIAVWAPHPLFKPGAGKCGASEVVGGGALTLALSLGERGQGEG